MCLHVDIFLWDIKISFICMHVTWFSAGTAFSAAYKKWEKAAIAGVSLVADAAEHLERTATDKDGELDQGTPHKIEFWQYILFCKIKLNLIMILFFPGPNALGSVDKVPLPLPAISQNLFIENITHTSVKLKLQLYPIDDGTRRALEMVRDFDGVEKSFSSWAMSGE